MKTLLIFDNDTKMAFFKKVLGDKYIYISTNGLLFDLPTSKLGIDILNDFNLQELPTNSSTPIIQKLKEYTSYPFFVITSPNENGVRLYSQILKLFRLDASTKSHITLPYLSNTIIKDFQNYKQSLDINLLETAITRRVTERLGGYFFSEFFTKFTSKFTYPIKNHLSLIASHIVSSVFKHVQDVHTSNQGSQLMLESDSKFKAHEVLYNPSQPLRVLLPKYYNSDLESQEVFDFIKEYSNELKLEKTENFDTEWHGPDNLNFEHLLSYLLQKYNFDKLFLFKILSHLYNSGYISYYQRSNIIIPNTLLETIRQHFKSNNLLSYLDAKKLSLLSKNVNNCILPVSFDPYTSTDNILIKQVHQSILDYVCLYFTKKQPVIETTYLFKLKKHYFAGSDLEFKEDVPDYLKPSIKSHKPTSKDSYSIQLYTLEYLDEGVNLFELFKHFNHSNTSLNIYTALDQLLHYYKYLELNNDKLYLTEKGFICGELLNYYSSILDLTNLQLDDKMLNSIRQGRISKDVYLHSWYHAFKSHHDSLLKNLD